MKIALVAVVVAIAIFAAGTLIGYRLAERPDAVTNSMLQEKIDYEANDLRQRIGGVDSKIDILLNIATNATAVRETGTPPPQSRKNAVEGLRARPGALPEAVREEVRGTGLCTGSLACACARGL